MPRHKHARKLKMPPTTATLSLGSAGLELPSARTLATERQLTLTDLPRRAMAIVGASLSKKDIRALRLVSRGVCSLAAACIKKITMLLQEHDMVGTVERALERYTGVPQLSVEVLWGATHLLLANGLLPRMQHLSLSFYHQESTDGERDEVAKTLQGATRVTSIDISCVAIHEGLRLAANCLALRRLHLFYNGQSRDQVDFRLLSRLSNLQRLSVWDFGKSGDLSSITCLTGLTQLDIDVRREVSLRPLAHLPRLVELCIMSRRHGDLPEDFVPSCLAAECRGNLKGLHLSGFGSVTAEAVRHLALCTSLVRLVIRAEDLPCLADIEPMLEGLPHLKECKWNDEEWWGR